MDPFAYLPALLIVLLAADAFGQGTGQIELARLDGPVRLDGRSDEPAWEAVAPLPLTLYLPTYQGEPTERTEIRVAYDDAYLYAAGRFYDSDPSGIRVNSLYRDRLSGDDAFALFIDTFNDNENTLWFMTTPAGIRSDNTLSGDGEGVQNVSWNTFWDVATVVTDEGWFAEIRIPLSSLRFQEIDGRVVMGLTATRYIARKNERVTFPAIAPKYPYFKPSVAQDVAMRGVRSRRPVYVTPYALGGLGYAARLDAPAARFRRERDLRNEAGLDVKYSLTDNLTLDLTLNTDFAQVEADDQQINLTRFSLFFPEKRQFFQERAALFDFEVGDGNRLLHSRRIGLTDQGEPVRILGGARMVGRAGAWDVGVLDMQTARHGPGQPAENFGVLRVRRPVFNPYSYAGGMMTSRVGADGGYNAAYGLDAVVRVLGDEYLTVKWSQSLDRAYLRTGGFAPLETGQGYLAWQRRSSKGLSYRAQLVHAGAGYDPGIGFVQHSGSTYGMGLVTYTLFPEGASALRNHSWNNITFARFRQSDGRLESLYFAPWWDFETKAGATGWVEPRLLYEDVPAAFALSEDAEVPAGRYRYVDLWLNYVRAPGALLHAKADVIVGGFYDGWRTTAGLTPTWRVSRHLELSGLYQLNVIRFPARGQSLTAHLTRLRVQAALNARVFVQAYLQYNTAARVVGVNTLFRYNFSEGTDLWVVYNHNLNTDRLRQEPALPLSSSNVLILKYTHTLSL